MSELLSIYIPTYNRSNYLSELLNSIEEQIQANNISLCDIKIYISNNASSDNTENIVKAYQSRLSGYINYSRNETNIGAIGNLLISQYILKGEYCWFCGDDELINPGALKHIINILKTEQPTFFLNRNNHYEPLLEITGVFNSYQEFADNCMCQQ